MRSFSTDTSTDAWRKRILDSCASSFICSPLHLFILRMSIIILDATICIHSLILGYLLGACHGNDGPKVVLRAKKSYLPALTYIRMFHESFYWWRDGEKQIFCSNRSFETCLYTVLYVLLSSPVFFPQKSASRYFRLRILFMVDSSQPYFFQAGLNQLHLLVSFSRDIWGVFHPLVASRICLSVQLFSISIISTLLHFLLVLHSHHSSSFFLYLNPPSFWRFVNAIL